jgi:nitrate/nitrite-specific signal transduction histidine kinase
MLRNFRKKKNKINYHPHSFRNWVNIFFGGLLIAVIAVTVAFYFFIFLYPTIELQVDNDNLSRTLSIIKYAIAGLTLMVICGISLFWIYFYQFIVLPLSHMMSIAEQIGHGQLDQTINVMAPLEIKRLSESINDFSVNLQEILLFVWNQTENVLRCIDDGECNSMYSEKTTLKINAVKQNMLELQKMVSEFAFFDVKLDQKKVFDEAVNSSTLR